MEGFKYYASYSLVLEGFVDNINKKIISTCSFSFSTADGIHATADIIASATDLVNGLFLPNPTFIIDFGKDVCKSDQINDNLLEKAFESIKVYKGLSNYPIGN